MQSICYCFDNIVRSLSWILSLLDTQCIFLLQKHCQCSAVRPCLVDVVVVDDEGQIEGEVDERSEQRLRHQQHKVPYVVRQVVDL